MAGGRGSSGLRQEEEEEEGENRGTAETGDGRVLWGRNLFSRGWQHIVSRRGLCRGPFARRCLARLEIRGWKGVVPDDGASIDPRQAQRTSVRAAASRPATLVSLSVDPVESVSSIGLVNPAVLVRRQEPSSAARIGQAGLTAPRICVRVYGLGRYR